MSSQKLDLNRGSAPRKDEAVMAYLCLQQVRRTEKLRLQTVLTVTGNLWTGHGLQLKPSRQWFLEKEGRRDNLDCAANKNRHFLNLKD